MQHYNWHFWFLPKELDALGDELLLDDDNSYLDEASSAPAIPEGAPGDRTTNRVNALKGSLFSKKTNCFLGFEYTFKYWDKLHTTACSAFRKSRSLALFLEYTTKHWAFSNLKYDNDGQWTRQSSFLFVLLLRIVRLTATYLFLMSASLKRECSSLTSITGVVWGYNWIWVQHSSNRS